MKAARDASDARIADADAKNKADMARLTTESNNTLKALAQAAESALAEQDQKDKEREKIEQETKRAAEAAARAAAQRLAAAEEATRKYNTEENRRRLADAKTNADLMAREMERINREIKEAIEARRLERQRLSEQIWDNIHRDRALSEEKYMLKEDMLKTKLLNINNRIRTLEGDIENGENTLGTCPDNWVFKGDGVCSREDSGNFIRGEELDYFRENENYPNWIDECDVKEKSFPPGTPDSVKLAWAKKCRINYINRSRLDTYNERAPVSYSVNSQQKALIEKVKNLVVLRNSVLELEELKNQNSIT